MTETETPISEALGSLIDDAAVAGFTIKIDGNRVDIYKPYGRSGRIRLGVVISTTPRGGFYQAYRSDVPLDITTTIRTIKVVREVLGL